MRSTTPQEVKQFIEKLKSNGIGIWNDDKGKTLYVPADNPNLEPTKTHLGTLVPAFNKACPDLDWDDWHAYVQASLPALIGNSYHPAKPALALSNELLNLHTVNKYTAPQFKVGEVTNIQPFLSYGVCQTSCRDHYVMHS
ncbi:hypothetical protein, partial [Vibrio casei]